MNKVFICILVKFIFFSKFVRPNDTKLLLHLFTNGATNSKHDVQKFPFEKGRESFGDLNLAGMRQQFNLGKLVRQKYPAIFDESFDISQIRVHSSARSGSVASAISQVLGIFENNSKPRLNTQANSELFSPPSSVDQIANSSENAVPVALTSIAVNNPEHDFLFDTQSNCPEFKARVDDLVWDNKSEYKDFLGKIYAIWADGGYSASEYSDHTEWKFDSAQVFSDALISSFWMKSSISDYNIMSHTLFFRSFFIFMHYSDSELCGYLNTHLFAEWVGILDKLKGDLESGSHLAEVNMFSASDSNLASVLNLVVEKDNLTCMVDFYNSKMENKTFDTKEKFTNILSLMDASDCFVNTSLASNLMVEVYVEGTSGVQAHQDLAVRVLFNNKVVPSLSLSLADFESLLTDKMYSDMKSKCDRQEFRRGVPSAFLSILVIASFAFTVLMFLILLVLLVKISSLENVQKSELLYIPQESNKELLDLVQTQVPNRPIEDIPAKK